MGQIFLATLPGVCSNEVGGTAMAKERSENFSDEVIERRSSVREEKQRVEREGWIVNS